MVRPLTGAGCPRVDPGDTILQAIGLDRTAGGVVYSACEIVAPGQVFVESARNRLILGEIDGGTARACTTSLHCCGKAA